MRSGNGFAARPWLAAGWIAVLVLSAAVHAGELQERGTYAVKNAFRDAVGGAAQSTVRVSCDGRRAALGTVVAADGLILTKASELAGKIVCHLFDGRRLEAKTIAVNDEFDLALLKINAEGLPTVSWSQPEPPPVGSWLATPGLETVPISIGVVSVVPRRIERRTPALGVIIQEGDKGPVVHDVMPRSGAAKAGLKPDDVITQLDGKPVESRNGLIQAIRGRRPGDTVRLQVLRGGEHWTAEVELLDLTEIANGEMFQEEIGGRLSKRRTGFPLALQHDSVLQPSQCGGPLVDLEGKVVGINIARASRVASYALPASAVTSVLAQMLAGELVATKTRN
jgi:serine protease Do